MKNLNHKKTFIIGIGNSGRQDDGLGWALLDELSRFTDFQGELIYRYQLNIEDAELIKEAETVIFVDATKEEGPDYALQHLEPGGAFEFTSHALKPEVILALCQSLYEKFPSAYTFLIKGYEWELGTGLTPDAQRNLERSTSFFEALIFGKMIGLK